MEIVAKAASHADARGGESEWHDVWKPLSNIILITLEKWECDGRNHLTAVAKVTDACVPITSIAAQLLLVATAVAVSLIIVE